MSPVGAIIWLIVVAAAVVMMIPRWNGFMHAYQDALSIGTNPEKAFYLFAMFWILKFCHEMGHAFACRRFGGEVHEMGLMLLVFIPTPYVDASSAWAFPSRWQRMFVGAGGMVVELFLASVQAAMVTGQRIVVDGCRGDTDVIVVSADEHVLARARRIGARQNRDDIARRRF